MSNKDEKYLDFKCRNVYNICSKIDIITGGRRKMARINYFIINIITICVFVLIYIGYRLT